MDLIGDSNAPAIGIGTGCGLIILVLVIVVIFLARRLSRKEPDIKTPSHMTDFTELGRRQKATRDSTYDEIGGQGTDNTDGDRYQQLDPLSRETAHAYENVVKTTV